MVHRIGWLRAAVLGAGERTCVDRKVWSSALPWPGRKTQLLIAGLAGLVAGAMSTWPADDTSRSVPRLTPSKPTLSASRELAETPEAELEELTRIYVDRGLDRDLAEKVAHQLTERDALGSHARDELGISETVMARPIQAALVSALTFAVGAVLPLIVALLVPDTRIGLLVAASSIIGLAVLGGLGASAGGAGVVRGAARVTFWGALAMGATAAVGALFGVTLG
ncbi:MAG: VIT1/CCC1 transporter family protein [Thalassovita sp.]